MFIEKLLATSGSLGPCICLKQYSKMHLSLVLPFFEKNIQDTLLLYINCTVRALLYNFNSNKNKKNSLQL